jgi:hypothetical protein
MTAPERGETTVEDDGGHDLALSGLALTAGKRASRARTGTRPDHRHNHTTGRAAALTRRPYRAFRRHLPTPVLSPAGSTHELQPGDRASSRDGPLTLLSVRGVMAAPAGDTSLVPLVACPKRLIHDAQDEST